MQRLNHLPRDTRDTLFLLAVIAWTIAPHTVHLPLWCSALAALILLWRGQIAWRGGALPSRWWLLCLLAGTAVATYLSHRTLLGRDAGTTFIVVLLALKTLELRAQRDAFVVFFLGFFTLLSNFFYSQSLITAVSMVIGLLGLLTSLVNSHMPVGKPPLMQAARTAARMALLGAPIMLVLFVLFPRMAPLWGMPEDAMQGRSGLSGSMQVGSVANLALDSSVAMRIQFDGATPQRKDLYFRGPVLSDFDGRQWRPLRPTFPPAMQPGTNLQVRGVGLGYQVTLEGSNRPWLLTLDATPQRPDLPGYNTRMSPALQWSTDQALTGVVRYRATGFVDFQYGPTQPVTALQDELTLPAGYNPRTLQLATNLRRDPRYAQASGALLVDAVLERLRSGGYQYTLEPGVYGEHSADEFWFDRKQGFCEHIASAFVVLMRALDVPARVVTGYQGGEANPLDGLWTVRQSDAHAWAEVWINGRGWVRVDPTAAVAPGRTGTAQRLEANRGVLAQALVNVNPAFALNLRNLWDAANNRWNQWVLNYTQSRQFQLLRQFGFASPGWEDLVYLLLAAVVGGSLAAWVWAHLSQRNRDPWLRLLHAAHGRLRQAGYPVPEQPTPRALAHMLDTVYAGHATHAASKATDPSARHVAAVRDWCIRMEESRYGPNAERGATPLGPIQPGGAVLARLRREFKQLDWPPFKAP